MAIIEIDSLPNLVTNTTDRVTGTAQCDTMKQNGNYVNGVGYALAKLGAVPNVYNYVDAGHHGWLGWDTNFAPAVQMMMTAATASGSTPANVHGLHHQHRQHLGIAGAVHHGGLAPRVRRAGSTGTSSTMS